jgi:medium-chain acyl-[acyl-carrier-protein] hydrolase
MTGATGTHGRPGDLNEGRWLNVARPNPEALLRLFCFPYAGGSALIYRSWPQHLPPGVEVCAVQLSGRGQRINEPPFRSLDALIPALAAALRPHLDRPFAFFGHSMGALVSFELARYLRGHGGAAPEHLFVSGHAAPRPGRRREKIFDLPEPEFKEQLRRLNGTPHEVLEHPELMELLLPLLRADFSVCDTYVYAERQPLDCPITAFGGLGDASVSREDVEAWAAQTAGDFSVRMLPGDHFFLHESEALLLNLLGRELTHIVTRLTPTR